MVFTRDLAAGSALAGPTRVTPVGLMLATKRPHADDEVVTVTRQAVTPYSLTPRCDDSASCGAPCYRCCDEVV